MNGKKKFDTNQIIPAISRPEVLQGVNKTSVIDTDQMYTNHKFMNNYLGGVDNEFSLLSSNLRGYSYLCWK